MRLVAVLMGVALLSCALAPCSCANVIYVKWDSPSDGPGISWDNACHTVAAGISAAVADDEVWVARGTYVERVTLKSGVALYGGFAGTESERGQRDWKVNVATLDAWRTGSTVTVPAGCTSATTIDGFTICDGSGTSFVFAGESTPRITGGGIFCDNTSCTISNNIVTGNLAQNGAGILCYSSSGTISGNTITRNSASGSNSSGGGIYCYNSSASVTDNVITKNSAVGEGGGLCLTGTFSGIVSGNAINYNTAYVGAGVYLNGASPVICNNTLRGNIASSKCGGLFTEGGSSPEIRNNLINSNIGTVGSALCLNRGAPKIVNNVISGNTGAPAVYYAAAQGDSSGTPMANNTLVYNADGALSLGTYAPLRVYNNIVAFNAWGILVKSPYPSLYGNCVFGNISYNYSGVSDRTGRDGNISLDPLLASSTYGNLHIQPSSPCRNVGLNSIVESGWVDMDGQARIQGDGVDIGADESDNTTWPATPTVIRVSPEGNDLNDGSTWSAAKLGMQSAIDSLTRTGGGEVWVRSGDYYESLCLSMCVYLYGGFVGDETGRSSRDWRANASIIHRNVDNYVVSVTADAGMCAVDGFTLTGGGSGVRCASSSTRIANDVISNCSTGVYCADSCKPALTSNTIKDMISDGYSGECGTIAGNTITNCGGYGIRVSGSGVVANNLISRNRKDGMYISQGYPTVTNNTITGNLNGISLNSGNIHNNIVAFNKGYGLNLVSCGTTSLGNNCVHGNTIANYRAIAPGAGDISLNPRLADYVKGDMHLVPGSPCIDAGIGTDVPNTDLDGNPRPRDGDGDGTAVLDIGCYECPANYVSIAGAKGVGDTLPVGITSGVSTAIFDDRFYVESADRACGVAVLGQGPGIGKRVTVEGTMTTLDGERVISSSPASICVNSDAAVPGPLGLNISVLGGGAVGLQEATWGWGYGPDVNGSPARTWGEISGLNNVGLLVRTSGKVTEFDSADPKRWFRIDDGSGRNVKCLVAGGVEVDPGWQWVSVTGISSCERAGAELHSVVRVRCREDIVSF